MHYQVVARSGVLRERWDYYPYWAPGRDKAAAERLAHYAAQSGHEAAVLQSVSVEMLEQLARRVVERHDEELLPALRYVPGTRITSRGVRREHEVERALRPSPQLDPYDEGPDKAEMDQRRLDLERGPAGDVTIGATSRFQYVVLPRRMDVLSAWLALHRRTVSGLIGGPTDGGADEISSTGQHLE